MLCAFFILLAIASILVFLGRIANDRKASAFAYAVATLFSGVAVFKLVLTVYSNILLAIANNAIK